MNPTRLRDIDAYRRTHPYLIVNIQNAHAQCGRFSTLAQALEHAATYRGGIVGV